MEELDNSDNVSYEENHAGPEGCFCSGDYDSLGEGSSEIGPNLIADGGAEYPDYVAIGFDPGSMEDEEFEKTVESLAASIGYSSEFSRSLGGFERDANQEPTVERQNHRVDSVNFEVYELPPTVYLDVSELEFSDIERLERRVTNSVPQHSHMERLSESQVPESLEEFSLTGNLLEEEDVSGWSCC